MRIPQPEGTRGSLMWLQACVERAPELLAHPACGPVRWVSPLRDDGFAEYRDADFLGRLGLAHLAPALAQFWPRRGPQWDALGLSPRGPVLVEAKAHLREFVSPASAAGPASRARIAAAFAAVQHDLGLPPHDWTGAWYQYANRLAHLWWLRRQGVEAALLFVSFTHDPTLGAPATRADWHAAFARADAALGLPAGHALAAHVHHVYPDVRAL
jgi:hypothetical protein